MSLALDGLFLRIAGAGLFDLATAHFLATIEEPLGDAALSEIVVDQRAGSTMTNATVAQTVKGTDGQNILKYKDGEKKVVVPEGTPIVTFVAATNPN